MAPHTIHSSLRCMVDINVYVCVCVCVCACVCVCVCMCVGMGGGEGSLHVHVHLLHSTTRLTIAIRWNQFLLLLYISVDIDQKHYQQLWIYRIEMRE